MVNQGYDKPVWYCSRYHINKMIAKCPLEQRQGLLDLVRGIVNPRVPDEIRAENLNFLNQSLAHILNGMRIAGVS